MKKDIEYRLYRINPDRAFNCQKLDPDYKFNKPTLLCFGGNMTSGPMEANAIAKEGRYLIGAYDKIADEKGSIQDVDIISVAYGIFEPEGDEELSTRLLDEEIMQIVDNQFMPLLVDDTGCIKSLQEVKEGFGMLTIFSHCYGATAVNNLFNEIEDRMQKMGFSDTDIKDVFSQVIQLSYAPQTAPRYLPTYEIKSCQDQTIMDWYNMGKDPKAINGVMIEESGENRVTLWSSQLANGKEEVKNEHPVGMINRNVNWRLESKLGGELVYYGRNADAVSQIASYVLAYSVGTSLRNVDSKIYVPKPTLKTYYNDTNDILQGFTKGELAMN